MKRKHVERLLVGGGLALFAGLALFLLGHHRGNPAAAGAKAGALADARKKAAKPRGLVEGKRGAAPSAAEAAAAPEAKADPAAPESDGADEADDDDEVDVEQAERDLARFGIGNVPKDLLEQLGGNWRARARVAKYLPNDEAKLFEILKSAIPELARVAAEKLGSVGTAATLPAVLEALVSSDLPYEVRQGLASAAAKLAGTDGHAELERLLDRPLDGESAGPVASALIESMGPAGAERVLAAARDGTRDAETRAALLESLQTVTGADERIVPGILAALDDASPAVRRGAIGALVNREESPRRADYVEALAAAVLRDNDAEVRREAAYALGTIADASALPALKRALERETETEARAEIMETILTLEEIR